MSEPLTELDETVMCAIQHTAARLMQAGSPLELVVVVPIWRNETGKLNAGPVLIGDPEALDYLKETLHMLIERIDAGEYAIRYTRANAPGGDG